LQQESQRGRTAQLELEAGPRLLETGQCVAGVDRQPDRAPGVGDAAGDRLADPPRGVGRELEALAPVELLDRVHEAEVALLDEVQQRQPRRLVLLGNRDDEPQVRLHERALGVVTLARGAAQLPLLGGGEVLAGGEDVAARGIAAFDLLRQPNLDDASMEHVFFHVGEDNFIAYFLPYDEVAAAGKYERMRPGYGVMNHLALDVDVQTFSAALERLQAEGVEVRGPIERGYERSIYFRDPNGVRLELLSWLTPPPLGLPQADIIATAQRIRQERGAGFVEERDVRDPEEFRGRMLQKQKRGDQPQQPLGPRRPRGKERLIDRHGSPPHVSAT